MTAPAVELDIIEAPVNRERSTHDAGDAGEMTTPDSAAVFQREWATYRKMVDNNYLFHREAYDHLRGLLKTEAKAPFRFLDIACGDAGETARVLAGLPLASYDGIDLSDPALRLAENNLAGLGCPVRLQRGEFAQALVEWETPVDVAWIGLSLHHFEVPGKLPILRSIRNLLTPGGLLLIYENAAPDGESRTAWMERWDLQRPTWTKFSDAEWTAIADHVHASDFPETERRWFELGYEAGFAGMSELYRAPTDLFRLYVLRK